MLESVNLSRTLLVSVSLLAAGCPPDAPTVRTKSIDYELAVPEGWTTKVNNDSTEYWDPKEREQVVVTVVHARHPMDPEEVAQTVGSLLGTARASVERLSEGKVEFEIVSSGQRPGGYEAVARGNSPSRRIFFELRVVGNKRKIVTATHYLYKWRMPDQVEERREKILDSLVVR
jgi:hypothetical protein